MAKKTYTKGELAMKVVESEIISVEVDGDKITVFLADFRRVVYDSNDGDYIEADGIRWVGDDLDYYSWVRDLVWF